MIEKIIANGHSGPAVAALDVAIKLGLAHGGWCREGDGIADRYHLSTIPTASWQMIVEKMIETADGSVFFIYGQRTPLELEKIKKTAWRLNKPFLLLDLAQERGFSASHRIAIWIAENRIRKLHVDGDTDVQPAESITDSVAGILEATFFLTMMETGVTSPLPSIVREARFPQPAASPPETMATALDRLEETLSLRDKATIANMAADELLSLHFTLGDYINTHFDLFTTNTRLLTDCRHAADRTDLAPTDAAAVIIRQLWERLRQTCRIRIIK